MKKVSSGPQVLTPVMASQTHLDGKTFCKAIPPVPVPSLPPVVFQGHPLLISPQSHLPLKLLTLPTNPAPDIRYYPQYPKKDTTPKLSLPHSIHPPSIPC